MPRSLRPLLALPIALLAATAQAQTFTDASDLLPPGGSGFAYGAAVADVDGDGRTDLSGPRRLLLQRDDGFEAVPYDTDVPLGAVFGDVDGDGRPEALLFDAFAPDIFHYHPAREALVPIPGGGIEPGDVLVQGSVFLDYDRDGALDLFIGNDNGADPSLLFRGLGDGSFSDESHLLPDLVRPVYGAHAADYDRDGDPDIYIGLCPGGLDNLLFHNNGASGFTEEAAAAGLDDDRASWGVVWFDFDNDGWLDVFVANMPDGAFLGTRGLFRNNGDGTFTDVAAAAGVAGPSSESSWNATAADFDNDGWVDLFVANDPDPSRLYRNNGNGSFTDVTAPAGLAGLTGIPITAGDVNGDGWVDLYFSQSNPSDHLFYNDGGTNGWLAVRLRGVASSPDGVGARVEVTAGSLSMVREVTAGDGMMSQSHGLTAHFGLGTAATASATVRWPSGQVDTYTGLAPRQRVTLVEGVGRNEPPEPFALLSPPDGGSVEGTATLTWEAADDDDAVTYTVHLSGPNRDRTYETAATTLTVPAGHLDAVGEYRWAVVARDAYSARTTLDPFGFTNLVVANEPGPPALHSLSVEPNPVHDAATVRFTLAAPEAVTLEVLDVLGRRIRREALGARAAGEHAAAVRLGDLGAGVYLVRLTGERSGPTVRRVTVAR